MNAAELARAIASLQTPVLLGFDVDGTLAPIVDDPGAARIPTTTLESLTTLSSHASFRVALVTGRDLSGLARMAPLENVWRAVEHGAVVLNPGQTELAQPLPGMHALDAFNEAIAEFDGTAYIERKQSSTAIHVRQLQKRDPTFAAVVLKESAVRAAELGLHVREGRAVCEAALFDANKGQALSTIARRSQAASVFYAGDDLTDFPAIEHASRFGIGVFVQSREREKPPMATATVEGVAVIAEMLALLVTQA